MQDNIQYASRSEQKYDITGSLLERKTGKLPKHLHEHFLAREKGGKWSIRGLVLALLAGGETRAFCSAYKRACVHFRKLLRARENSSDENVVGFGFAFDYLRILQTTVDTRSVKNCSVVHK